MSDRIQYVEKPTHFWLAVDGSRWEFTSATRNDVLSQMRQHAMKVITALDTHAGRKLTERELSQGVEHLDDIPLPEKIAEASAKIKQPAPFEGNPYQHALDNKMVGKQKPLTPKQALEKARDEWNAKKAAELAAEEFAADPKRVRAVQHATRELQALRFDPAVPQSQIVAAEKRLELAKSDPAAYAVADREWQATKKAKIDAQAAEIDSQIQALRKAKADIDSSTFDPPAPPEPTPAPKVDKIPVIQLPTSEFNKIPGPVYGVGQR